MYKLLRKFIFWVHLVTGLAATVFIAILCATGFFLAFEKEVMGWVNHDVEWIEKDESSLKEPMSVEQVIAHVKAGNPDGKYSTIVVHADKNRSWLLIEGRNGLTYVNPYNGEWTHSKGAKWQAFFRTNLLLHRWLLFQGEARQLGKSIVGVANLIFLFLCLSGLILWFPPLWRWVSFKKRLLLNSKAKKTVRNLNWHNVFGFWAMIPLVLLILTGSAFSYRWMRTFLQQVVFEPAPQAVTIESNTPERSKADSKKKKRLNLDQKLEIVRNYTTDWTSVWFQIPEGNPMRPSESRSSGPQAQGNKQPNGQNGPQPEKIGEHPNNSNAQAKPAPKQHQRRRRDPNMVFIQPHEGIVASIPLRITIDPYSGAITSETNPKTWSLRQKLGSSIRTIHTGAILGIFGKTIAALSCLVGLVLVYTGCALSYRRFIPKARRKLVKSQKA